MKELPEDVRGKRIAWDKEVLKTLGDRRKQLLHEIDFVDGQIRGVTSDLHVLEKGRFLTSSPIDYSPKRPVDILIDRIKKKIQL